MKKTIRFCRSKSLRAVMLMMLMILTLCLPGAAVRAADGDVKANHGAVKICEYDYDKLVTRLARKYPGVFQTAAVYNAATHAEVGSVTAMRVLISNSKNHTQGGNSGVTVKYINGSTRSTSNWAQGLGNFEAKEYFSVNGNPGYCFDWATPSAAGSHVLSASLSDAGITVGTGADVMELAQAAKMLTKDNYALITNNASDIAKGLSIAAYSVPGSEDLSHEAVSIAKSDVVSLLQDTTADGIAFKRALVQMLVWGKMNAISFGDYFYSFYGAEPYVNKEGQTIEGESTIMLPAIGYSSIIDLDKMYSIGKTAWEGQSAGSSADYQYEYALTVGVPFNVPAGDVGRIIKIVEANGGKIESGGSVTVNIGADRKTVTLTATQAIANWTGWLSASDSSSMIYSSKPYDPSTPESTGSGQFIVDVSEMVYMRARVKAVIPTGTVKITKTSANTALTNNNSCYSLAGAKYTVYTDSACSKAAKDTGGSNAVLTTAENGSSNTLTLEAGTYWIKETAASPGYGLSSGSYKLTLGNGDAKTLTASDSQIFKEPPLNDPMGIILEKSAAVSYEGAAFDMSGAQYTVKYYAGQYTKDTLPQKASVTWVIETKKLGKTYRAMLRDGYVISGSAVYGADAEGYYVIPLGTLTVEETKAPAGFSIKGSTLQLMDGDGSDAAGGAGLFNLVSQNGAVYVKCGNVTDDTEEGIRILQKETVSSRKVSLSKTSDDGKVSGISFTLSGTLTAGGKYSITKTTDAKGAIDFGEVPYGSYTLTENLSADQAKIYAPNDPAKITVDDSSPDTVSVSFHNTLKRGSLDFDKVLESSRETLACVPFRLTNTDTDEAHCFILDADGRFDSERGKHSAETNGADEILGGYVPEKDIVPDAVIDELAAAGAGSWGVWFGPGTVNDAQKALPVGNYRLEELKTERTKTLVMASLVFSVEEDGQSVSPGTVENGELTIGTAAADAVTGTHNACAGAETVIVDTVSYSGAKAGETYTVNGELMLIADDGSAAPLGVTADNTFTAEETSGTVELVFTFDASALAGRKVVVYETLTTAAGQFAADHKDPNDEKQIISFPKIATAAKDSETGIGVSEADWSVTVVDTVTYQNLIPGREYSIKGELYDKVSGDPAGITAEQSFTPEAASGSVALSFSFSGTALAGRSLVAFETLFLRHSVIAEHKDPDDDAQTVRLPRIATVLTDGGSGTHQVSGKGTVTLTDTVSYTNLRPGMQYTVKGELTDRDTGKSTGITAETTFTPDSPDGSIELSFSFDGSRLQGTVMVAYERVYYDSAEVAAHADLNDAAQTVFIPGIDTAAEADDTKDRVTGPNEEITVTDRVDCSGLEAGREYTLKGELYDKESGEPLGITAEKTFTAEAQECSAELVFTFDGSLMAGKTVVAFETLFIEGREIAVHHDIDDEEQSVYIPAVETDAANAESGLNHIMTETEVRVVDTVTYRNLLPGREYTLKGELYDRESGELAGVTAEAVFTPDEADGSVEMIFAFDASAMGGKALVAFETLYFKETEIAAHADINDERQTVYVPAITTDAKNDETGSHEGSLSENLTLIDEVTYSGLVPGETYTLIGILMDKASGEPLLIDGREVTGETSFTAEKADGCAEMRFSFSSVGLGGKTAVVFETLYYKGAEVAVHANIEDEDQAVVFPAVTTKAADAESGSSTLNSGRIADEISFSGLVPGAGYVIVTTVYDRTAGVLLDMKDEQDVSPETSDGTVTVTVAVDAEGLGGHALVVYEELWMKGENRMCLAAEHKDPEAKTQTVHVPVPTPETGDSSGIFLYAAVMLAAGAGVIVLAKRRGDKL